MNAFFKRILIEHFRWDMWYPLGLFYTIFQTNNLSVSIQLLLPNQKNLIIIWHCAPLALLIDTCDSRISHDDSRFGKNRSSFVAKSQTYTGEGSCFCTIFTPLFVIILMIKFAEIRITHISILHNTFSAKFIVWSVTDDTDASYYYYNIIT